MVSSRASGRPLRSSSRYLGDVLSDREPDGEHGQRWGTGEIGSRTSRSSTPRGSQRSASAPATHSSSVRIGQRTRSWSARPSASPYTGSTASRSPGPTRRRAAPSPIDPRARSRRLPRRSFAARPRHLRPERRRHEPPPGRMSTTRGTAPSASTSSAVTLTRTTGSSPSVATGTARTPSRCRIRRAAPMLTSSDRLASSPRRGNPHASESTMRPGPDARRRPLTVPSLRARRTHRTPARAQVATI